MIDVLVWLTPNDKDYFKKEKVRLPFDFREKDVHRSLKRPCGGLHYKRHSSKTKKTMIGGKGGFIEITLGNLHLAVFAIGV